MIEQARTIWVGIYAARTLPCRVAGGLVWNGTIVRKCGKGHSDLVLGERLLMITKLLAGLPLLVLIAVKHADHKLAIPFSRASVNRYLPSFTLC